MATKVDLADEVRGDTWTLSVAFVDTDGNAIDITNYQYWWTVKLDPTAADTDLDGTNGVQVTTVANDANAANGILTITVPATDTANLLASQYSYDIQEKNGSIITTLLMGKIKVISDITRSTS